MEIINKIIKEQDEKGFPLKTSRAFYRKINIPQRRWGQLMRNEKEPTVGEIRRISKFFGVSFNELIQEVV